MIPRMTKITRTFLLGVLLHYMCLLLSLHAHSCHALPLRADALHETSHILASHAPASHALVCRRMPKLIVLLALAGSYLATYSRASHVDVLHDHTWHIRDSHAYPSHIPCVVLATHALYFPVLHTHVKHALFLHATNVRAPYAPCKGHMGKCPMAFHAILFHSECSPIACHT